MALYLGYCIVLAIFLALHLFHFNTYQADIESILLTYLIGFIVPVVIVFRKRMDIYEPINLFAFFYYTYFFAALFYISDLSALEMHFHHLFSKRVIFPNVSILFKISLFYIIIGYISFLFGYYSISINQNVNIVQFSKSDQNKADLLDKFIPFFIIIGLINYFYAMYIYGQNPIQFLLSTNERMIAHIRGEGKSVLGYGYYFLFSALYFWHYKLMVYNKKSYLFYVFFFIGGIIYFIYGRLTLTLTFLFSFFILSRYCSKGFSVYSKKHFLFPFGMVILAISLYVLRIFSNYYILNVKITAYWDFIKYFLSSSGAIRYILYKGNIPSIPAYMNIYYFWEKDFNFLFGKSFIMTITNILPSRIKSFLDTPLTIVSMLKEAGWYGGDRGNPTISLLSELYVNLSWAGIPIGMFLAGIIYSISYTYVIKKKNYWFYLFYIGILLRFFTIIVKVESSNLLSNAIWLSLPTILLYIIITKFFTKCVGTP